MVGWWTGDGTFTDRSGNNHDGTNHGVTFTTGFIGQAFDFDVAQQDHIDFGDISDFDFATSYTVEGWVQYQTLPTFSVPGCTAFYPIFANEAWGWSLNLASSGLIGFGTYHSQTTSVGANSLCPLPADTLVHVAGVVSDTEVRVYINGELRGTNSNAMSTFYDPGDQPYFGRRDCGSGVFYLDGQLDDFAIYSRALTQAEIQSIVDAGDHGKCIPG